MEPKRLKLTSPTSQTYIESLLSALATLPSSTSTLPSSTSSLSSLPPRYWRCPLVPYPYYTIGSSLKHETKEAKSEIKETKEAKETKTRIAKPLEELTKCISTDEVTQYLSEDECNKSCNLLSQLPSSLYQKVGLMEPKLAISLFPTLSTKLSVRPETKVQSRLAQHLRVVEEIKRIFSLPNFQETLLDIDSLLSFGDLGEKKESIPLILEGLVSMIKANPHFVEDRLFKTVLNRALKIAITNELLDNVANVYTNVGYSYVRMNDYDKAIENYNKSLSIKKTHDAYHHIGLMYHNNLRNDDKAIENFSKALLIVQTPQDYIMRGQAYMNLSDYSKAADDFSKIIDDFKDYKFLPMAYYYRGQVYAKIGRYDDGINDIDTFLRLTQNLEEQKLTSLPEFKFIANAHFFKGRIYLLEDKESKALPEFDIALSLEENPEYYNARAVTYRDLGDNTRALADIENAIRLNPNDSYYHSTKGSILVNMNRLDEAKREFDTALRLGQNSAQFFTRRAKYREKLGIINQRSDAIENARRDYEHALALDPKYRYAIEGLEKLASIKSPSYDYDYDYGYDYDYNYDYGYD